MTAENRNEIILNAIQGDKKVDKTPVWIMRQAGRYLPEFRATRLKHDFFSICRTPALAMEVTLQPLRRFEGLFDASIIFSDILVIPQCLGMIVEMKEAVGPHFPFPLTDPAQFFQGLQMGSDQVIDPNVNVIDKLEYVYDAIKLTRQQISVPLHGFCGAPWTLLAYMVEGGGSKQFAKIKAFIRQHKKETLYILDVITRLCIDHLVAQIEAGAELVQVFDSWAGELSPEDFEIYSLPYLRRIASEVKQRVDNAYIVVFAKGAHFAIEELLDSEYDIIGLDWTMHPVATKKRVRSWLDSDLNKTIDGNKKRTRVTLQGNLDPTVLYAPQATIVELTTRMLKQFLLKDDGVTLESDIGYICNLGHGIQPTVPVENVQVFLQTVRDVSSQILR